MTYKFATTNGSEQARTFKMTLGPISFGCSKAAKLRRD